MNQKQAALLFVLVGLLAAGLAFLTAPTLAALLGAVEAHSEAAGGSEPAQDAPPASAGELGTLGAALPRPPFAAGGDEELGTVDPETPFSPVVLQEILLAFAPEVGACRQDWDDRMGPLPAPLVLRLLLTPDGLEEASLEGVEAPEGFRTCLGAVIWQTRWPAPAAATTLRYPLVWEDEAGSLGAVEVSAEPSGAEPASNPDKGGAR